MYIELDIIRSDLALQAANDPSLQDLENSVQAGTY
jgi:hypothetical protein